MSVKQFLEDEKTDLILFNIYILLMVLISFHQKNQQNLINSNIISLIQRIKMLSERRKYNYNISSTSSTFSKSHHKKTPTPIQEKQNPCQSLHESKKIEQLEINNKNIIEETTKQFKKLESDVQRVEKILEDKENSIKDIAHENNAIKEEKNILIEAIFEKDSIIKQLQQKVEQLILNQLNNSEKKPSEAPKTQTASSSAQTDPLDTNLKQNYNSVIQKASDMQQEIYKLKEDLFDANSKLKVVTQEFEAYKILKEIQNVSSQ